MIFLFRALFFFLCIALSACALRQSAVVPNEFRFSLPSPAITKPTDKTIAVLPFTASPSTTSSLLLYRVDDVRYESDFYNRFLVPPAQMLTGTLRSWLIKSHIGKIQEPGAPLTSDFLIQPRLTELYADYRNPDRPHATAAMVIVLIRQTPDGNHQVFERSYRQESPMRSISPEAAVEAMSQSIAAIFRQFIKDFQRAF